MQIKRLEIKNCLGIKELELEAGQVNLVKGANEAGKTSLLESIEKALRNTDRRVNFVHSGAREGTLFVELDDGLSIDRRIKENGRSSVKLTREGEKVPKPETFLKSIAGEYAFNPVDFLAKKDKEQAELLLSLIPMKITEEDLQGWFNTIPPVRLDRHPIQVLTYLAEKHFYDMRTIANSEVKECRGEIDALFQQLPDNYRADDWRDIEICSLWEKVQQANKINSCREQSAQTLEYYPEYVKAIENRFLLQEGHHREHCRQQKAELRHLVETQREGLEKEIEDIEEEIRQRQEQITLLNNQKSSLEEKGRLQEESLERETQVKISATREEKKKELDNLHKDKKKARAYLEGNALVDIEPLEEAARQAEEMKGYISLYDNMKRLESRGEKKREQAAWLDDCVKLARSLPAQLLSQVELPVSGLGINEDMHLTVDDLPIRNLSTGRQIKLALDIARATAGTLKLICIDRFESLDPINQEQFFKEIQGDGYQYFISTTQLDRDNGSYSKALTITTREGGQTHDAKVS